jgi:hypothetical protein
LDLLVRTAESAFRSGQFDDALAAYDRARAAADKQSNRERAFEFGFVAAAIEHKRQRSAAALERYRDLAIAYPSNPRAGEAHLLAVYHAGELAKGNDAKATEQYVALLNEHLERFKRTPTAGDAARRLGRLREFQKNWSAAVEAYKLVSPQDAKYLAAVEGADRCYQAWLDERKAVGQSTEAIGVEAARYYESLIFTPQGDPPQSWTETQRFAALAAARAWLSYTRSGYTQAEKVLAAALRDAKDAPAEWRSAAQTLLVCAMAGGGRCREAAEVLRQITGDSLDPLLAMLGSLSRMSATVRPEARKEIAALQLQTIELLQSRMTDARASTRTALERQRAQALMDSGQTAAGLAAYRILAAAHPRDLVIQSGLADALAADGDTKSLEAALAKWNELQGRWAAGSEPWLRAQLAIATLTYRLGNKSEAGKLLRRVKVMYPELGGPSLALQYEELLRKCP